MNDKEKEAEDRSADKVISSHVGAAIKMLSAGLDGTIITLTNRTDEMEAKHQFDTRIKDRKQEAQEK